MEAHLREANDQCVNSLSLEIHSSLFKVGCVEENTGVGLLWGMNAGYAGGCRG
jgi:hypothetical protein